MNLDLEQAGDYLDFLEPDGGRSAPHTYQLFDDKGERRELCGVLFGPFHAQTRRLSERNAAGAGVYVMLNAGDLQGRRTTNVVRVRVVAADFDGVLLPAEFPVEPHAIVQTSAVDRHHVYWRANIPLEAFRPAQLGIAATLGTDTSVCGLPQVMRLPGFYHRKREPVLVRLVHVDHDAEPLTLDDLKRHFPAVRQALEDAARARERKRTRTPADEPPEGFHEKFLEVVGRKAGEVKSRGIGRHELVKWAARTCLDNALTQGAAEDLMLRARDLLPDRDSGPVPDDEVLDLVEWTYSTLEPGEPWRLGSADTDDQPQRVTVRVGS